MSQIFSAIIGVASSVASVARAAVGAVSSITGLSTATVGNIAKGAAVLGVQVAIARNQGTPSVSNGQKLQANVGMGQVQFVTVGRTGLGGHILFKGSHGELLTPGPDGTEYLTHIVALSYKPITAVNNIYINGSVVNFDGDVTTGERKATNAELQGVGGTQPDRFKARIFLGHNNAGQGLGAYLATLFPDEYNANCNFGDYAIAVLQFQKRSGDVVERAEGIVDKSPFQQVPTYRFDVNGAAVFDPREPTHLIDDPSTWTYSANSALIENMHDIGWQSGTRVVRNLVGSFYPSALLDFDQVAENADYCDSKGFTCNGLLVSASQSDAENIRATYGGVRHKAPGKRYSVPRGNRPYAGAIDLTNARVQHIKSFDAWGRTSRVPNAIITKYSNANTLWEEESLEWYSRQSDIDADGGITNAFPHDLPMVTDADIATDLRTMEVAFLRRAKTLTLKDLEPFYSSLRGGSIIDVIGSGNPLIDDVQWAVSGISQGEDFRTTFTLTEQPPAVELVTNAADYPEITTSTTIVNTVNSSIVPGLGLGGTPFISIELNEVVIEGVSPVGPLASNVYGNYISPLIYLWEKISGDTLTLSDASDPDCTFTGTVGQEAVYSLRVTDSTTGSPLTSSDGITIKII